MNRLFTKEFLDNLSDRARDIDILSFLIDFQGMSFNQAIEAIAEYYEMEPKYIEKK